MMPQFYITSTRKRELLVLFALTFVQGLLGNMLRTVVPLHALDLGASTLLTGILVGLPEAAQVFVRIPAGGLSAWLGRRPAMVGSYLCSFLGLLLIYLIPGLVWMALAQVLIGISFALFWPTVWAYMTDVTPRRDHGPAIGFGMGVSGLGILTGPIMGGVLLDLVGSGSTYLITLMIALIGITLAWSLPRIASSKERVSGHEAMGGQMWLQAAGLMKRPAMKAAIGWSFLGACLDGAIVAYLPLYLYQIGASGTAVGTIMTGRKVALTLSRFIFNRVANQVRLTVITMRGFALDLGVLTLSLFTVHPLLFGMLVAGGGLGNGVIEPACKILTARCTNQQERTLGLGVEGTFLSLGRSMGSSAVGLVAGLMPLAGAFGVIAGGLGMAGVALRSWSRRADIPESTLAGHSA